MPTGLLTLAAAQWGTFCRAQAIAHGMTPQDLLMVVRLGQLRQPHPGVYVVAGSPDTPRQRLWIAYLAVRRPCAFSGRTSGWLLGLPECSATGRPHIAVPEQRRPRSASATICRLTWWDTVTVEYDAGLPRLDVLGTVLTAAPSLSPTQLLAVVQHVAFHGSLHVDDLRDTLRRGLAGGRKLGAALDAYAHGHDSGPEVNVRRSLARRRLKPDHCNVAVRGPDGSLVGPFDGYYEVGVAYEYDGRAVHDTVEQSVRDDTKSSTTGPVGVRLVRLDSRDLRDEARLIRRIGTALAAAPGAAGLTVVHAGHRACLCGWAPGVRR